MRGEILDINRSSERWRFDYYDGDEKDSDSKYLRSLGYQGGGPSWEGIVFGLLKLQDPKVLTHVRFDAEADGLAIWSNDRAALETISRLVGAAKADRDLLHAAIHEAKRSGQME